MLKQGLLIEKGMPRFQNLTDEQIPAAKRQAIVEDLLGGKATSTTVQLVSMVIGSGRGRDLPAIVDKLNSEINKMLVLPDVVKRFEAIGAEAIGSTPDELAVHLQRESARWSKLIAERGIKLD